MRVRWRELSLSSSWCRGGVYVGSVSLRSFRTPSNNNNNNNNLLLHAFNSDACFANDFFR